MYYSTKLVEALKDKFTTEGIQGWKPSIDSMSGTLEWNHADHGSHIFATPLWDDKHILPINVMGENGEELLEKVIDFKPTLNLDQDIKEVSIMLDLVFTALLVTL